MRGSPKIAQVHVHAVTGENSRPKLTKISGRAPGTPRYFSSVSLLAGYPFRKMCGGGYRPARVIAEIVTEDDITRKIGEILQWTEDSMYAHRCRQLTTTTGC